MSATVRELYERWWMVAVGLVLIMLMPVVGLVWAAVMAFTQREDLAVFKALVVVTAAAAVLVALQLAAR